RRGARHLLVLHGRDRRRLVDGRRGGARQGHRRHHPHPAREQGRAPARRGRHLPREAPVTMRSDTLDRRADNAAPGSGRPVRTTRRRADSPGLHQRLWGFAFGASQRPAWMEKPSAPLTVAKAVVITTISMSILVPMLVVVSTSLASPEQIREAGG